MKAVVTSYPLTVECRSTSFSETPLSSSVSKQSLQMMVIIMLGLSRQFWGSDKIA
jgi:hypothetical protein